MEYNVKLKVLKKDSNIKFDFKTGRQLINRHPPLGPYYIS